MCVQGIVQLDPFPNLAPSLAAQAEVLRPAVLGSIGHRWAGRAMGWKGKGGKGKAGQDLKCHGTNAHHFTSNHGLSITGC